MSYLKETIDDLKAEQMGGVRIHRLDENNINVLRKQVKQLDKKELHMANDVADLLAQVIEIEARHGFAQQKDELEASGMDLEGWVDAAYDSESLDDYIAEFGKKVKRALKRRAK